MARLTRDDWTTGALAMLAKGTIADVRVEPLARRLGVTKGSFYHHFDDRQALLDAVFEAWVAADTERIIELVAEGSDPETDPVAALHELTRVTLATATLFDGIETAVRDWAASDPAIAERCAVIDQQRLDYVTGLLVSAGVTEPKAKRRADVLYRVVIGEYTWRRYDGAPIDFASITELVNWLVTPG